MDEGAKALPERIVLRLLGRAAHRPSDHFIEFDVA
jgi:hypothetical protein